AMSFSTYSVYAIQACGYKLEYRFRKSGNGYAHKRRTTQYKRPCFAHHRRKHHWSREQEQQEVCNRLRSREELPPFRIYLGPVERYVGRRATGHADRHRSWSANWSAYRPASGAVGRVSRRAASSKSAEPATAVEIAVELASSRGTEL